MIEVASRFIVGQENDTELEGRRVEYGFFILGFASMKKRLL